VITWEQILLRLSLAAAFGAIVGIERERKDWAAGLRTHMMVCVGAALTMMVSAFGFEDILGHPAVVLDPSRIAAQVISGIGFIGAGTILFLRQEVVRGLTTAAGLWTVAAIGLAAGGGMYFAAVVATVIVLVILWLLKPVERKIFGRYRTFVIHLEGTGFTEGLQKVLEEEGLDVYSVLIEKSGKGMRGHVRLRNRKDMNGVVGLAGRLERLEGVDRVWWEKG